MDFWAGAECAQRACLSHGFFFWQTAVRDTSAFRDYARAQFRLHAVRKDGGSDYLDAVALKQRRVTDNGGEIDQLIALLDIQCPPEFAGLWAFFLMIRPAQYRRWYDRLTHVELKAACELRGFLPAPEDVDLIMELDLMCGVEWAKSMNKGS